MLDLNVIELCDQMDSNCFTQGRLGHDVQFLVLHDTCGPDDDNAITDPVRAMGLSQAMARYLLSNVRQVSAHYAIGAEHAGNGSMSPIFHLQHETSTCYHVGGDPPEYPSTLIDPDNGSTWHGFSCNLRSIGIEIFGPSDGPLGPRQAAALAYLLTEYSGQNCDQPHGILGRWPILRDQRRIWAHKHAEPGDRTDGVRSLEFAQGLTQTYS